MMRRFVRATVAGAGVLGAVLGLHGCNKQSVTVNLRSLQDSTEVTFVCKGKATTDEQQEHGLARNECPDLDNVPPLRTTLALITQVSTNELAIVDVVQAKVIDVDPAVPGYTFLRLPSRPGAITSSPGGAASFVGLMTPGKTGISAIPTTCVGAPTAGHPTRDVTSFAACSLPSTPGDMVVMVEPPAADGDVAQSCDDPTPESKSPPGADAGRDCPANLTTEHGPDGRRKLVVAMPEQGELAVIDAQELLDRQPGSFDPCQIERHIKLDASPDTSGQVQKPPPDLELPKDAANTCKLIYPTPPQVPANFQSRPSGLSLSGDGKLYVGDLGVPEVHVIDGTSVCALRELPPLLPMAFTDPNRVVTTSHVAASPLTPSGHQYVYAVDASDQPTSVMAFDVSPGSTKRTPIVRNGSARQPREVPDRISFAAPVQDIDFVFRDLPREDPVTGVADIGALCDPNPDAPRDPASPGVQYRTTGDYQQGARPRLLRGLFGMVLLSSGQVATIDVEDFDEPCRRPYTTNASTTEEDFRGCIGDTLPYSYLTYDGSQNGTKTVSDEASCNMVEPHRARAAAFGLSIPTLGVGAPTLRGFPRFQSPSSVTNLDTLSRPKMLAVPFKNPDDTAVPPVVNVGTTLYSTTNSGAVLSVNPSDPNLVDSLALPLYEPRAYPTAEHVDVTYEGRIFPGTKPSGFISDTGTTLPDPDGGPGRPVLQLSDSTALFCNNDVHDPDAMTEHAERTLGMSAADAAAFGATHGDYVQITGDFPDILDAYWKNARHPRSYCLGKFGPPQQSGVSDLETKLQASRDLTILGAYQDHLVVVPRVAPGWTYNADCPFGVPAGPPNGYCTPTVQDFDDCFPAGVGYTIRGTNQWVALSSNPQPTYDMIADPAQGYKCVHDCDPRKKYYDNRVFEIGSTVDCSSGACAVGLATPGDGPCSYDPVTGGTRGVSLDDGAAPCIFENLTARFAVYRGLKPSVRGMRFSWDTQGGFVPLTGSLTTISTATLPQRVHYLPEFQSLAITDASSLGLAVMSIDTLEIISPWPVY